MDSVRTSNDAPPQSRARAVATSVFGGAVAAKGAPVAYVPTVAAISAMFPRGYAGVELDDGVQNTTVSGAASAGKGNVPPLQLIADGGTLSGMGALTTGAGALSRRSSWRRRPCISWRWAAAVWHRFWAPSTTSARFPPR